MSLFSSSMQYHLKLFTKLFISNKTNLIYIDLKIGYKDNMRIIAGVGKNKNVIEAIDQVDFEVVTVESEEELVELLYNGFADAAIRGSLNASKIMAKLREKYPKKISRASFIDLNGQKFLLAPVGIDEGDDVDQKLRIAEDGSRFLLSIGIKPKLGVLSGGRPQDKGRSKKIDESIEDGELLTSMLLKKLIEVKHYFILIEDAIADGSNFIIAPDGISGNLIFRSLVLLGGGEGHGAVTLGMDEIYVDTSRSLDVEGYKRALEFAHFLVKSRKVDRKIRIN
jgi:putative methanogen marker protein 4